MPFLAPLALLGLLFLPVVVAMYLLRLRRDEQIVPSTLLWQRLMADIEANAPWQRLRRSLLLLLQLLLVALLAILAARPFLERPAGLAGDVVIVIDTSASMAATDVTPNRLEAAKDLAIEALKDLPAGGKVSVIAAGKTARVVANGTTDLGRVRAAIDSIAISPSTGDLADALRLANALAARSGDAEILVATDAALASKPEVRLDHPVSVLQVGRGRSNQAIVALAVRTAPSGVSRSVFVSIANLDLERSERRLEVWGDGVLLEARDVYNDPQTRTEVIIDDVPHDVAVVEVRLSRETEEGSVSDLLELDDRAWAIVPPDHLRRILLVGEGDPYLETALSYLPNTELYGVTLEKFGADTHPELFDLIVFEGALPATLPDRPILAIGPERSSPLGDVTGVLRDPLIGALDADEPILRYVDLSTTHVGTARKMTLPAWARTIIPGPAGAPLLYTGTRDGFASAVLAFQPRQSDLPLQVAFPILMSNLVGELLGGSAAPTEAVEPGSPVTLPVPAGATGLTVTRPDGSTIELAPGTEGGTSVSFSQTDQLGVYSASPVYPQATPGPSATAAPSATATPSASVSPSSSPGGSPTPVPTGGPIDPNAPQRFAVDLFDPDESTIAPGSAAAIEALGLAAGASGGPSASPTASGSPEPSGSPAASAQPSPVTGGGTTAEPRPPARDELWVPIVLLVLLILVAEWLVYQRDAVLRLWRGATTRLGRGGSRSA
ncbi:MAG TPA: VWA domain-containing protein [Candidatus Polarisedimenticolia bacterium]|nr:VWA domain-containing protein [Candidatus Polarisedimenticolia bacterium]